MSKTFSFEQCKGKSSDSWRSGASFHLVLEKSQFMSMNSTFNYPSPKPIDG